MNRSILLFSFLCCFLQGYSCASVKNNDDFKRIMVQLQGKRYDKLYIETRLFRFLGDGYYDIFAGSSSDGYLWEFNIPDLIYQQVQSYTLTPELYDTVSQVAYIINLYPNTDHKNSIGFMPNFEKPVQLTYLRSDKEKVSNYYIVQDSVVWVENAQKDIFTFELAKNKDMAIAYEMESNLTHKYNMEEQLYEVLDSMITQYSDSKYLISQICMYRFNLSRSEIQALYDKVSDANKASYAGILLKNVIELDPECFYFTNMKLPVWDTHKLEPVIDDITKPTLIIFSASWCGSCHAMIPTLKEIYEEGNNKLNMVYISIDKEKYAEEWKGFMRKEQIPWRSLILLNDPLGVQLKYNINEVPTLFFVEPAHNFKAKKITAGTYDELKNTVLRELTL